MREKETSNLVKSIGIFVFVDAPTRNKMIIANMGVADTVSEMRTTQGHMKYFVVQVLIYMKTLGVYNGEEKKFILDYSLKHIKLNCRKTLEKDSFNDSPIPSSIVKSKQL